MPTTKSNEGTAVTPQNDQPSEETTRTTPMTPLIVKDLHEELQPLEENSNGDSLDYCRQSFMYYRL